MFEKLKMLSARLDELEMRLSAPDLYDDPARAARLLRERNELEPIVEAYRAYERAQQQLADATEMLSDPDMKELAQEELQQAKSDIARLEGELKLLLLPKDPNDEKNIYVEIRGGAGGEESALFAADLRRIESAKFPVLVHVIGTKGQDFFGRALDKRALFPEDGHRALLRTHRGRRKLIGAVEGKRG